MTVARFAVAISLSMVAAATLAGQRPASAPASLPVPTFPAVVAHVNDPGQALALLDRQSAPADPSAPIEAFALRAYLLSRAGRHRESAQTWDDAGARDSDLTSFAARAAVAELVTAGDPDAAASRVRSLVGTTPGRQDDLLLLDLADSYQSRGQPGPAADIYRDVLRRERQTALADRARTGVAACTEALGQIDAALLAWHDAAVTWQLPDTFASARRHERQLADRVRRLVMPLTVEQYFDNAERLTGASHFDDAIALLEEGVREHILAAGEKVEAAIIDTLYGGRHDDAAEARAAAFLTRSPDSTFGPQLRLIQIRLDARNGNLVRARTRLASFRADPHVPIALKQGASRTVAAHLVGAGAVREAIALYRQVLIGPLARADRFDVNWRIGIAALVGNDGRAALAAFAQARKYASSRSSPRSTTYWLAVALDRTGSHAKAARLWGELADADAYDYYGLRAAERLHRPALATTHNPDPSDATQERGPVAPALDVGDEARASSDFRAAMILARAGLANDAASQLVALAVRFRTDNGLALVAARAAAAAGDHATAASLVTSHFAVFLARPPEGMPDDIWQMAFPRAFWPEVQAAASSTGVDPLLLLSLMRRESRFVQTAKSRAGALGLFQLMPETARDVAGATGARAGEDEHLLETPANADLAARLVKRLLARYGNAIAPTLASYNAGEDRVDDWWRAGRTMPEDLFVDAIPYGETRQYVREVLANYETYKRLYATHR